MKSVFAACKKNQLLSVVYGDNPERRIVRVINKRDMTKKPVSPDTLRRRPSVQRGDHLITCQSQDGKVRSFYAGAEVKVQKLNIIQVAVLQLQGKLPPRVTV